MIGKYRWSAGFKDARFLSCDTRQSPAEVGLVVVANGRNHSGQWVRHHIGGVKTPPHPCFQNGDSTSLPRKILKSNRREYFEIGEARVRVGCYRFRHQIGKIDTVYLDSIN
jgi:hypothetical protein